MAHQFKVPSMACLACSDTITQAIHKIDTAATVEANLQTKIITVTTQASDERVQEAIVNAGYPVA
ncbi:MAG: heavy-metal-associated domain-containing protein [Thermosynechococcaceae cyanobacterium]